MTLDGTFTFGGPRALVWDLLQDPAVLAKVLPGTERLELTGPDQFRGVMKVSVGPVTAARFDVSVALTDKVAPDRFGLQIDGKGAVGHTRGTAKIELSEATADTTLMQYTSDVQIGGKIAALGQRLIESVGRKMMKEALDALELELRARLAARGEGS